MRDDRDDDQRHQREAERDHAWAASARPPLGSTATTTAPTIGSSSAVSREVAATSARGIGSDESGRLMRGSPPGGRGRRARRRRGPTARRSGRSRSGPGGRCSDMPAERARRCRRRPRRRPRSSKADQAGDEPVAGPHEQLLVDRVAVEVGAGRPGERPRPFVGAVRGHLAAGRRVSQAMATPTSDDEQHDQRSSTSAGTARSRARRRRRRPARASRRSSRRAAAGRRATESAASTISGTVITLGDSCGCTPSSQRFSPKKVISISRVM